MTTRRRLDEAKCDGADRIYGWPTDKLHPAPRTYVLKVTDGMGRVYLQRELREELYFEAVRYWCELTAPTGDVRRFEEVCL